MKIKEMIGVLTSPDNLRIVKDGQQVYIGYLGNINNSGITVDWGKLGLTGEEEIKKFRLEPNISHKNWKELQLIPPYEPERVEEYRFSDLQMTIYYSIYI